jgi:dCMP deaminase
MESQSEADKMKKIAEENTNDGRVSKERYYINIAKEVSERSTCLSTRYGAVIVKNDQIVATGYNGAPRKTLSCLDRKSCLRRQLNVPSGQQYELCRSVHAEQNAIINAARAGVSLLGGDIYMYGTRVWNDQKEIIDALPCFICKKMIINAGLEGIIYMTKENKIAMITVDSIIDDWQNNDLISAATSMSPDKYNAAK